MHQNPGIPTQRDFAARGGDLVQSKRQYSSGWRSTERDHCMAYAKQVQIEGVLRTYLPTHRNRSE
jgi:hypothetical protein